MPGRDMTGPQGMGPMTGRGFGLCNSNQLGYNNRRIGLGYGRGRGLGLGRGMGRGLGLGFGRGYGLGYGGLDYAQDNFSLRRQKDILQSRIEEIEKELKETKE